MKDPIRFEYLPLEPMKWNSRIRLMYAWEGERVVLATNTKELSKNILIEFISILDSGWKLYYDLIGSFPKSNTSYFNGKVVIAAIDDSKLTCGIGCGYIGSNGIEVCNFYTNDYPQFEINHKIFSHYYFYEMGRNYYLF